MFDKLEGLVDRLDTVLQELNDPDVAGNQNRFRDLMKEQNELTPSWKIQRIQAENRISKIV